jgi:hypothetical protein
MLDKRQTDYLRALVRVDLRKTEKSASALRGKHGADYDGRPDRRLAFIEDVYRALGGEPKRIRDRPTRTP